MAAAMRPTAMRAANIPPTMAPTELPPAVMLTISCDYINHEKKVFSPLSSLSLMISIGVESTEIFIQLLYLIEW